MIREFFHHRLQPQATMDGLMQAARASTPDWTPSTPLSDIRNAHVTNTPAEMETALRGDANCLEADVRLAGDVRPMPGYRNRPVIAAHWDWDTHGLTLPEWLKVGSASGRMLKLDFKSAAAIRPALKDLKASGIPGERLMLNGGIDLRRGTSPLGIAMSVHNLFFASHTSVGILQEMRRAYPSALIALSPSHQPRAERDYRKISDCATAVGGPLTFPLAASMVDEEVVRRLKPYGSVSVYASEGSFKVTDVAKDTEHFRRMGVDGVIDLAQH